MSRKPLPLVAQARLSPLMAFILAAIAGAALLAALFALNAVMGPMGAAFESGAPEWKAPTLAIVELNPPKPASADAQALTRPIFSKTRKPSPKAANARAAEPVTSGAPMGVCVAAIVKKGKAAAQAFVISAETPEGAWKKVGDAVDSWTISDISGDALKLRSGDGAATVPLYAEAPSGNFSARPTSVPRQPMQAPLAPPPSQAQP